VDVRFDVCVVVCVYLHYSAVCAKTLPNWEEILEKKKKVFSKQWNATKIRYELTRESPTRHQVCVRERESEREGKRAREREGARARARNLHSPTNKQV